MSFPRKASTSGIYEPREIMVAAIWFGLTTGLVEGLLFIILMKLGRMTSAWIEIAWIAPLIDLILFCILGTVLILLARLLPKVQLSTIVLPLFSFLMFFNWIVLSFSEYVKIYALLVLAAGFAAVFVRRLRRSEQVMIRFFRKSSPWLAALTCLIFTVIQGGKWIGEQTAVRNLPDAAEELPNILFIVIDTLRADHLSLYGYERRTSPIIDQIGKEGTVFENAFSPSSYTLPSHVSLMTGQYIYQHGVEWENPQGLFDHPSPTIAEVLMDHGFRTAAFSANLFWFTREQGFGRGFMHFEDYFQSPLDTFLRTTYGRGFEKYILKPIGFEDIPARKLASDVNRSVLKWIHQEPEKPFFIFVNYLDTHDPYLPPQPYRSRFSAQKEPGGILNARVGRDDPQITEEEIQGEIDAYDGSIAYVDDQLGYLKGALEDLGVLEDTIIIVTSDHGEAFGEHSTFLHQTSLYLEEIYVPLILWGDRIPSGLRISQPVSIASIPATILQLINKGEQDTFSSPSLTRLWEEPVSSIYWPDPIAELAQQDWRPERSPASQGWSRAIIHSNWHYIEYETRPTELFNWLDDPQETNNQSQHSSVQNLLNQLHMFWLALESKE